MHDAKSPPVAWLVLAEEANCFLRDLRERLRMWGAMHHALSRAPGRPGRWVAAFDAVERPPRSRICWASDESTDRDVGESAADDLWDAVAASWALVTWLHRERLPDDPGSEHLVADLLAAGRWLAQYPVEVSGHDAAIADLFAAPARATA
jgi:hypothetical protein